jgi:signal transduction histidine kinase
MLDDLGLAAAVEHHVDQFSARTGIACSLAMNREEFEIDGAQATALYRIVQEALTNVARHARATRAIIRIEQFDDGMHLVVEDDGCGFAESAGTDHFGLVGMRERVQMLDGRLQVDSAAGRGTAIDVRLPRNREVRKRD